MSSPFLTHKIVLVVQDLINQTLANFELYPTIYKFLIDWFLIHKSLLLTCSHKITTIST